MTKDSRTPINNMTADELSPVFFRAYGWLRLKAVGGDGFWINPFTRSLATYSSRVLLTTQHESDAAFCRHFEDTVIHFVQKTGMFPAAIDAVEDAMMIERLNALGMEEILTRDPEGSGIDGDDGEG